MTEQPTCPYCQQAAGTPHDNACRLYTDRTPFVTADQIMRAGTLTGTDDD